MMMYELFMVLLFAVSVLNGLFTEAVKKILKEKKVNYSANAVTGCIAIVLSIAAGVCYVIMTGAAVNAQLIIWLVALVFLSWLAAMVGYDKVLQAITQIKTGKYMEAVAEITDGVVAAEPTDDVPEGALDINPDGTVNVYDEDGNIVGYITKERAEELAAQVTEVAEE